MTIFEVTTRIWNHKFTFNVCANTATEAMEIVKDKPASELLEQLKVGDLSGSLSSSLVDADNTGD
jgi:hypothetical protein